MKFIKKSLLALFIFAAPGGLLAQDSLNVSKIGEIYDYWGGVCEIAIQGDYAYLADYEDGLWTIDISDSTQPEAVSHYSLDGYISDVECQGAFLYMTVYPYGLMIFDLSNPAEPEYLAAYSVPEAMYAVKVRDDLAYIAGGLAGFRIVDVSDPANPQFISQCLNTMEVRSLDVEDTLVYLADYDYGIKAVNVSDPENPQLIGYLPFDYPAGNILVQDGFAYLGVWGNGIYALDVSSPDSMEILGYVPIDYADGDLILNASTLIFPAGFYGFYAYDFINPAQPVMLTNYVSGNYVSGLEFSGNELISAEGSSGLYIYDIQNLSSVELTGSANNRGDLHKVEIYGDYAYVVNYPNELIILNIENVPVEIDRIEFDNAITDINIDDIWMYAVMFESGCSIMNISDPENPVQISEIDRAGGNYRAVEKVENRLYLSGADSLHIFNISNPTAPEYERSLFINSTISDIEYREDILYTYSLNSDLKIFSTANASNPSLLSQIWNNTAPMERDIELTGNYLLVNNRQQISIFNITDPTAPFDNGSIPLENVKDIEIAGDHIYTADYEYLRVYNFISPLEYSLCGYYRAAGISGLALAGTKVVSAEIYSVGMYESAEALTVEPNEEANIAESMSLLEAYPNPFNSTANISFSIEHSGYGKLAVYDIQGREIQDLGFGIWDLGKHSIVWDAKNRTSGVYFVRLEQDGKSEIRKLVLIK